MSVFSDVPNSIEGVRKQLADATIKPSVHHVVLMNHLADNFERLPWAESSSAEPDASTPHDVPTVVHQLLSIAATDSKRRETLLVRTVAVSTVTIILITCGGSRRHSAQVRDVLTFLLETRGKSPELEAACLDSLRALELDCPLLLKDHVFDLVAGNHASPDSVPLAVSLGVIAAGHQLAAEDDVEVVAWPRPAATLVQSRCTVDIENILRIACQRISYAPSLMVVDVTSALCGICRAITASEWNSPEFDSSVFRMGTVIGTRLVPSEISVIHAYMLVTYCRRAMAAPIEFIAATSATDDRALRRNGASLRRYYEFRKGREGLGFYRNNDAVARMQAEADGGTMEHLVLNAVGNRPEWSMESRWFALALCSDLIGVRSSAAIFAPANPWDNAILLRQRVYCILRARKPRLDIIMGLLRHFRDHGWWSRTVRQAFAAIVAEVAIASSESHSGLASVLCRIPALTVQGILDMVVAPEDQFQSYAVAAPKRTAPSTPTSPTGPVPAQCIPDQEFSKLLQVLSQSVVTESREDDLVSYFAVLHRALADGNIATPDKCMMLKHLGARVPNLWNCFDVGKNCVMCATALLATATGAHDGPNSESVTRCVTQFLEQVTAHFSDLGVALEAGLIIQLCQHENFENVRAVVVGDYASDINEPQPGSFDTNPVSLSLPGGPAPEAKLTMHPPDAAAAHGSNLVMRFTLALVQDEDPEEDATQPQQPQQKPSIRAATLQFRCANTQRAETHTQYIPLLDAENPEYTFELMIEPRAPEPLTLRPVLQLPHQGDIHLDSVRISLSRFMRPTQRPLEDKFTEYLENLSSPDFSGICGDSTVACSIKMLSHDEFSELKNGLGPYVRSLNVRTPRTRSNRDDDAPNRTSSSYSFIPLEAYVVLLAPDYTLVVVRLDEPAESSPPEAGTDPRASFPKQRYTSSNVLADEDEVSVYFLTDYKPLLSHIDTFQSWLTKSAL